MSPRSPFVTLGVSELPLRPTTSKVAQFSVCGVTVDD